MHSRLISCAVLLLSGAAAAGAGLTGCSSSPSSGGGPGDGLPSSDGNGNGGTDGGTTTPASGAATWTEVTAPTGFDIGRIAGDARGIWAVLYEKSTSGEMWSMKVVAVGPSGALTERFVKTVDTIVSTNYLVTGLSPVTSTTAVIGGEWLFDIIGPGAPETLGSSGSYISTAYGRAANDVWVATRTGVLQHDTGGSSIPSFSIADQVTMNGLWQSRSVLYLATDLGVRSAALPLTEGAGNVTSRVLAGDFQAIAGDGDDDAFAVARGGLIAHFDGTAWKAQASGTTSDLIAIAVRSKSDAWASSNDALLHYDGTAWSTVKEATMPKGASSVAIAADGTLWAASEGRLLHRSAGAVTGTPTKPIADSPDGGACAFGEPNDTSTDGTELTLPASVNACAPSMDSDNYKVLAPAGKAGFLSVTLTDTSGAQPLLAVDASIDTSTVTVTYLDGAAGSSKSLFLPVPPGELRNVEVSQSHAGITMGAYALDVKYRVFDDAYEPNDTYDKAATITSGTPITSYFPTGAHRWSTISDPGFNDDADWYIATRPAGAFTVSLTNVPADSIAYLSVDSLPSAGGSSTHLGTATGALGAPVTFAGNLAVAGKVRVEITDTAPRVVDGTAAPGAFTQKYTLVVGN